jgi:hypothetical protein
VEGKHFCFAVAAQAYSTRLSLWAMLRLPLQ